MNKTSPNRRAHWIRFNPTEWLGICEGLTDAQLGMFHRVVERLWATPGNTLSEAELIIRLRIENSASRLKCFRSLQGTLLQVAEDRMIHIPELHEAFAAMQARSEAAKKGSAARWQQERQDLPLTATPASTKPTDEEWLNNAPSRGPRRKLDDDF